ncbi:MAG: alpha/beta fold hydrolase [Bryobacteraceae bacterium]|nr:alpha/beta fold hydrolase [Bryobacteraceae bacterium]
MIRTLYLHGFASSPQSFKARFLAERFAAAGWPFEAPDLNGADFRRLTVTEQLRIVEQCARGEPVHLIGSSLGGWLAALYAARHDEVRRLVLLAPAFGFPRLYAESLGREAMEAWRSSGALRLMHYGSGAETELGWQFMEDALRYEDEPAILQPCLILHGVRDDVVPVQVSRQFARTRTCCELREVDSDHELRDRVEEIWLAARGFLSAS